MPQPRPPVTYASLCALFTAHLTVAVHTILAVRELYPSTTFLTVRAYNLPVKQSRHPGVCAWINDAAAAVETELLKGIVRRVVLVIFEGERSTPVAQGLGSSADGHSDQVTDPDPDAPSSSNARSADDAGAQGSARNQNRPLERYVWDLARFPVVPKSEVHTPFIRQFDDAPASEQGNGEQPERAAADRATRRHAEIEKAHIDVQEQFRGLLSRLSTINGRLKPLPAGCTFTLCVELKDEADPPIGHPQPWIPAESGMQNEVVHMAEGPQVTTSDHSSSASSQSRGMKRGKELGGARTVPVRTVDAGEMAFEMWVEEGQAKFDSL